MKKLHYYSFKRVKDKNVAFFLGLVYLFNGTSTRYGLFNTKILSIYKYLIVIISIFNAPWHFLKLFVYTHLHDLKYLLLFDNNYLFAYSFMISNIPI